jgi:hypothetical protein
MKTIYTDILVSLLSVVIIGAVIWFIRTAEWNGTCEDDMFINGWLTIIGMVGSHTVLGLIFYLPRRIKTGKWE